jgi:hypothetical protein
MASTKQIRFIGGARIGSFNATIPFAQLLVAKGRATLHCLRKYELTPSNASCEAYGSIPLLSHGVQFHHIDTDFPDPLIFWCIRRRSVLDALESAGFELR